MRLIGKAFNYAKSVPLVQRELISESRRTANHRLRVLAAVIMVASFAVNAALLPLDASQMGPVLFHIFTLILAMTSAAPLLAGFCRLLLLRNVEERRFPMPGQV